MSNIDRRIELAFEFIETALKNPDFLEGLPDRAVLGLGDDADRAFTEESERLARSASQETGLPQGMLIRRRKGSATDRLVEYEAVEA